MMENLGGRSLRSFITFQKLTPMVRESDKNLYHRVMKPFQANEASLFVCLFLVLHE